jgi:hypothetical protein
VLQRGAALFAPTGQSEGEPRWAKWLLVAIVMAGAALRFWGLGDIGLHREDEDTTALPALHILEDGTPRFPSGMYYARAIAQSYLIAGSVWTFGNTEWALRLPSAICGVALIALAYYLGRRFLLPVWNLAFTAVVAFLPSLILASQTARMYIFLLACLAGYAILIFRWERTQRPGALLGAVAVMMVGLQFHTLAAFAACLVFFPALLHGDVRRFWQASVAFAAIAVGYVAINEWMGSYYPQPATGYTIGVEYSGPAAAQLAPPVSLVVVLIGALCGLGLAWLVARRVSRAWPARLVFLLVLLGVACQAWYLYHIALLLLAAAAVVALRSGRLALSAWLPLALVTVALAIVQGMRAHAAGVSSFKNIVGIMVGWPSVWPYIRVSDYSVVALVVCAVGVAVGLWRLARRQRLPDFWLLFILWGWLPLLLVGSFVWFPPPRYTVVTLLPMLLVAIATLQWLTMGGRGLAGAIAASSVAAIAIINPIEFANTIDAGYSIHPDHQGAAQFVRSQHPGPRDLVLAEDVIVQTYYLDRVDYWLLDRQAVASFVERVDGVVRDIYTHSRIVSSAEELQALIDSPDRGAIYIVGSGENQSDGRLYMRGAGIQQMLTSGKFPVVYTGRDQLTTVWKIPAREH